MYWSVALMTSAAVVFGTVVVSAGAAMPTTPSTTPVALSPAALSTAALSTVPGSGAEVAGQVVPRSTWTWPTEPDHRVLQRFDPPISRWGSGHRGIDLAVPAGGAIYAPNDGQVSFDGMVAGRSVLVIAHAGGLRSTFEPVAAVVAVGVTVRRGDVIGQLTAHAGHCTPSTCLHWGVLRAQTYLDPLALLEGRVILLPMP